jgi:hypothetical protein
MDTLKRWREPATWVVLIALALNVALGLAGLLVFSGPEAGVVASAVAYRMADPLMIIVLAGLVATCVLTDRTPHARLLTGASMIIAGVAVLLAVILAVVGVISGGLNSGGLTSVLGLFTLLTILAIPVVGLGLLIKLWQLQPAPDRAAELSGSSAPMAIDASPVSPPPDPELQPTWQADAAAGAVWRTAGEAAAGAPASGWGTPGPEAGWQPIPTETGPSPEPTGPTPPDRPDDTTTHRWSS